MYTNKENEYKYLHIKWTMDNADLLQLEFPVALSTLKALNRTAYESWYVGELLLNQCCQRLNNSCKNHIYLLCSNKIFRCRIESMRNYYSRLTNLYVPKTVTASLRQS